MEVKHGMLLEVVEKQNERISELERQKQVLLEQQREMAIEYQKLFDMTQVEKLLIQLVGADMKKILEGDYSVKPVSDEEIKSIKSKVMAIIGKEI